MRWPKSLVKATLLKRYKRFLADVQLENGECITVHCPNTGAMTGCDAVGSSVWLLASDNPKRKYPYTWELVEVDGALVCVHSARANALVAEKVNMLLPGYCDVRPETKLASGSRVDFALHSLDEVCYAEVKSVTLLQGDNIGLFPDAVSKRATKHIEELVELRAQGNRAVLIFAVLHGAIKSVAPAEIIDPVYAAALRTAVDAGVEVIAIGAKINLEEIELTNTLPVLL